MMMAAILRASVFAQDVAAAMLRSNGQGVFVNGILRLPRLRFSRATSSRRKNKL